MCAQSHWLTHTTENGRGPAAGEDHAQPVDARRCTVQLSTGRLYLDVVSTPATALFGHDTPPLLKTDPVIVERMLSSLASGYVCVARAPCSSTAGDTAVRLGRLAAGHGARIPEVNALDGEPESAWDLVIVHENETLGRTGCWLASSVWRRPPDFVVVGEAIALGSPFGAVLASQSLAANLPSTAQPPESCDSETNPALGRVAAAITAVEGEGLLQHGRELAEYLVGRLTALRNTCPEIESVHAIGLSIRIAFTPPITATTVRRGMCERGVLTGVDRAGRLAIDPPLALRIAEADVVTGALRAAIMGSPMISAPQCCAACEKTPTRIGPQTGSHPA